MTTDVVLVVAVVVVAAWLVARWMERRRATARSSLAAALLCAAASERAEVVERQRNRQRGSAFERTAHANGASSRERSSARRPRRRTQAKPRSAHRRRSRPRSHELSTIVRAHNRSAPSRRSATITETGKPFASIGRPSRRSSCFPGTSRCSRARIEIVRFASSAFPASRLHVILGRDAGRSPNMVGLGSTTVSRRTRDWTMPTVVGTSRISRKRIRSS